jgi:hypothetical protein
VIATVQGTVVTIVLLAPFDWTALNEAINDPLTLVFAFEIVAVVVTVSVARE